MDATRVFTGSGWGEERREILPNPGAKWRVPARFLLQASAGTISRLAPERRGKVNDPTFSHQLGGPFYGRKN